MLLMESRANINRQQQKMTHWKTKNLGGSKLGGEGYSHIWAL